MKPKSMFFTVEATAETPPVHPFHFIHYPLRPRKLAMNGIPVTRRPFLALALSGLLSLALAPVQAQVVTTIADSGPGSLRQAIADATSGATITFTNILSGQTIFLTNVELSVGRNLTIDASSLPGGITINGHHASRIFDFASNTTNILMGLRLTNGLASGTAFPDNSGGCILLRFGAMLTIANSTLSSSSAGDRGGGIFINYGTLTLTNSTLSGNCAVGGGGIYSDHGTLTLNNSTLSDNCATNNGGGVRMFYGTLMLNDSTLWGNSAVGGGGIYNDYGALTLANSTLSRNYANYGGGIRGSDGTLLLNSSTLSDNNADTGGGIYNDDGNFTLNNSIVAGNTASSNSNIYSAGLIIAGNSLTSGDPMLTPLGNYGGPTQTMPPLPGSPAIDAGGSTSLTTDQRGFARVVGTVDIGAVETQPTTVLNTNDSGYGSLRDTVGAAFPGTTITFTTTLSGQTILLSSGQIMVDRNLSIDASSLLSVGGITINGNHASRIFEFASATTNNLTGLTLTNGYAASDSGGGILNLGDLTLNNSILSGNSADYYGGGICNFGDLTINNSTLSGNSADDYGGGIINYGDLTLNNSTLSGNSASWYGGGIENIGDLTINNSTLSGNSASWYGGGIDNFSFAATITLNDSTLWGNSAVGGGGGIYNWLGRSALSNSTLSGNSADLGGGIFNDDQLTVVNSTLSSNSAYNGGGIYNYNGATLTLNNCTLRGNLATNWGGGIANDASLDNSLVRLTNSTVAGNFADAGGGICNSGDLTIYNATLSGNYADWTGGGIYNAGNFTLTNSIVAGNTASSDANVYGSFTGSHNLTNGNPMLAPLGNYGGPTETMLPLPGSPAIDAGGPTTLTTDQRGFPRLVGSAVDIGAVESGNAIPGFQPIVNTVQDAVDGLAGDGISLREAVTLATNGSTITFAPSLFGQTIVLTHGQLCVDRNLSIDASSLPGGIAVDGNHASRIFEFASDTTNTLTALTLSNGLATGSGYPDKAGGAILVNSSAYLTIADSTLIGNHATGSGGGIYNSNGRLTLNHSEVSDNSAEHGGGISLNAGYLWLTNSTLSGNSAGASGGGIDNYYGVLTVNNSTLRSNSCSSSGGGINSSSGSTRFNNSTLSGNSAHFAGGGICIFNDDDYIELNNSTLSGNSSESYGGGIYNNGYGALNNCTLSDNAATNQGGGIYSTVGTLSGANTLVAGNSASAGPNVFGVLTGSGNLTTGDPMLAPLADYGGPTQTMPPLPSSPAIDAGGSTTLTNDQRGFPRLVGNAVDIGAVEFQGASDAALVVNPTTLFPSCAQGEDAPPAFFEVRNSGRVPLSYTVSESISWLSCTPDSGTIAGRTNLVAVNYSTADLTPGTYNGTIIITSEGVSGSPQTVNVSLTIMESGVVAWWRFEPGTNGSSVANGSSVGHSAATGVFSPDVPDSSGHGNDLSVWGTNGIGGYTYRSDTPADHIPQTGDTNSLSVQNADGYPCMFTSSDGPIHTLAPPAWTIEVSFKPENGGYRTLVGRDSIGTATNNTDLAALYFQIPPGNSLAIKFCDVSGYWHEAISSAGLVSGYDYGTDPTGSNNVWQAAAAVCDGTTLKLYYRNIEAGDSAYALVAEADLTHSGSPDTRLTAGAGSGSDWTHGTWTVGRGLYAGGHTDRAYGFIDEVRISDTALTPGSFLFSPKPHIVVNVNDSGPGSLRQAIADASNGNVIFFMNTLSNQTILLTSGQLLVNKNLTIDASDLPGGIVIDGNASSRIFEFASGTTNILTGLTLTNGQASGGIPTGCGGAILLNGSVKLTIADSTIVSNAASQYGGGIFCSYGYVVVSNSILSGNSASWGGGIMCQHGMNLVNHSTIWNNSALNFGGGIVSAYAFLMLSNSTLSGNFAPYGGGIYSDHSTNTLNESTLNGNSASDGGGGILSSSYSINILNNSTLSGNSASDGGGIYCSRSTNALNNSTVSGNTASYGGGIYSDYSTNALNNSTVSGNSAFRGGGIYSGSSTNTLNNTIVAGNSATNSYPNVFGSLTGSHNLTNGNPMLAPLGNYGGSTETMPPLPGSPAIDAGGPTTLTTDQRGFPRIVGSAVDIGAVEFQGASDVVVHTDTVGDLFAGVTGDGILDITAAAVSHTVSNITFRIFLAGDPTATDWGKYMIAIHSESGGDTTNNPWLRPIGMDVGMNCWLGAWVDYGSGVQAWHYTDGAWNLVGGSVPNGGDSQVPELTITKDSQSVTITSPLWLLGLSLGQTIQFDIYTSGSSGTDGAIDALANPAQTVADWGQYYNSGTNLCTYTLTSIVSPQLGVNPTAISPGCTEGQNASSGSFEVWNSGAGTMSYTVSESISWLSCTPTSGTSTGEHDAITVNYTTADLVPGTYNGTITVTAAGASGSPQTVGVTLTVFPGSPSSVSNYIIATFDTNAADNIGGVVNGTPWVNWYGAAYYTNVWDPSDASNNPASGSMKIVAIYPDAGVGGMYGPQFLVYDGWNGLNDGAGLNGYQITNFQCDVRFDPGSQTSSDGTFGNLEFGTRDSDNNAFVFGSIQIPSTNTGWVHVSLPVDAVNNPGITNIPDLFVKLWSGTFTNTTILYVDNIMLCGPEETVTLPWPTMAIERANPGLRIFAGDNADIYSREQIATLNQLQSWYDNGIPATYSVTITNFPAASCGGWEYHMFLLPINYLGPVDVGNPYGNQYADYNASNLIAFRVLAQGTHYEASVSCKTNLPSANPNRVLASVQTPVVKGTWNLTFNNNTSATLSGPGGISTNFTLAAAEAATFANPLVAYFGVQANTAEGLGQHADISQVQIAGLGINSCYDDFTRDTELNPMLWTNVASKAACMWLATTNTPLWINWSVPAIGFGLGVSTNIALPTDTWVTPALYSSYQVIPVEVQMPNRVWTLIPSDCMPPGAATVFFRLSNPPPDN